MSALTDRKGKLVIGYNDFHAVHVFIDDDFAYNSGSECVTNETRWVHVVRNNIDLLAVQFADNSLNSRALHTDASADRVNRRIARINGDLRTVSWITGCRFNTDNAVVDFSNVLAKELHEEAGVCTRHNHLRSTARTFDVDHESLDAVFHAELFGRHLLFIRDNGFGAAEINDNVVSLKAANVTRQDFALTILEFVKDLRAFRVANLLNYNLFGRLGCDTTKFSRVKLDTDGIAKYGFRVELGRITERDFDALIRNVIVFNDCAELIELNLIAFFVIVRFKVSGGTKRTASSMNDGLLKRINDDSFIEVLVFRDTRYDLAKFRF